MRSAAASKLAAWAARSWPRCLRSPGKREVAEVPAERRSWPQVGSEDYALALGFSSLDNRSISLQNSLTVSWMICAAGLT
jgi:hypothetical protein